ncbi:exodeoxyribonuclease V subunit alpha [Aestuariimicrobium soli]|uniref:exodeoxyribonuclease V subunit alpha n=1 Tax=Aestuariimicrobium soli TaxID=2035834 RepID=UPI003EB9F331
MRVDEPVISATGVLAEFNAAGVLQVADVQLAQVSCRLSRIDDPATQLAAALAVRELRRGSVCVDLATIRDQVLAELRAYDLTGEGLSDGAGAADSAIRERLALVESLPWPEAATWASSLEVSASDDHPYRLEGTLFYLARWWRHERDIAAILRARESAPPPRVDLPRLEATVTALFEHDAGGGDGLQRQAALVAARSWTSVVAGGPGTGKTTTVARMLAALQDQSERPLTAALAAPSGKAAARLEQSVREEAGKLTRTLPPIPAGQTLHGLLGARGVGNGFTRHAGNPLPHDVVVLDEASMVDVAMFAALLAALRPTSRLVIVGDPHQLSSVDAGRVLADIAAGGLTTGGDQPTSAVVELERNWRNTGDIDALARAVKAGDADAAIALLGASTDGSLVWDELDGPELADVPGLAGELVDQARTSHAAALAGDAAVALSSLDTHRILVAHREGRHGVGGWSRQVQGLLRHAIDGYGGAGAHARDAEWYPGRPILVTANSRDIAVFNGDSGVIVNSPDGRGGPQLALPTPHGPRLLSPSLVDGLESMYALTVHKAQGSQFERVTVVLPPETSPLLTREMFYTAITRARKRVRVVGTAAAVRAAIDHHTRRVSGLRLTTTP